MTTNLERLKLGSFRAAHVRDRVNGMCDFYAAVLVTPVVKGSNVSFRRSMHYFTQKEIERAAARYYSNLENVTDLSYSDTQDICNGYLCTKVYANVEGEIATRFVVKFRMASKTDNIRSGTTLIGMFTAREINRSAERAMWITRGRKNWFVKMLNKLFKKQK